MFRIVATTMLMSLATVSTADVWGGFIDGTIDGAIIGGIVGGEEGALDGAVIGGTIGAIDGAQREIDRERYYRDRYYHSHGYHHHRQPQKPKKQMTSASQLVFDIQVALARLGYAPGPADGVAGKATARAVQAYKRDHGLPQDNLITRDLLRHMRQMGA